MPIYEYACSKCGKITDVLQKMNDPAPEKCEHCGEQGTLSRVVSRTSFVLKGGGWYADLYGSSGSGSKDSGSKDPKASAASSPPSKDGGSTSVSAPASTASSTTSTASSPSTPAAPAKPKAANE